MTLSLLIGPDPGKGTVIFADPAGQSLDETVSALAIALGGVQRFVFPLPDETTRRHATPPVLMRSRHADLWYGLSSDERSRVVLATGPSAAYLVPLAEGATAIVAVREPTAGAGAGAWRALLGGFAELDGVPDDPGSTEERGRWSDLVESATGRVQLVRDTEPGAVAGVVAGAVGLGRQRAGRVAGKAAAATPAGPRRDRGGGATHWLDELLWSLSSEPVDL